MNLNFDVITGFDSFKLLVEFCEAFMLLFGGCGNPLLLRLL